MKTGHLTDVQDGVLAQHWDVEVYLGVGEDTWKGRSGRGTRLDSGEGHAGSDWVEILIVEIAQYVKRKRCLLLSLKS